MATNDTWVLFLLVFPGFNRVGERAAQPVVWDLIAVDKLREVAEGVELAARIGRL